MKSILVYYPNIPNIGQKFRGQRSERTFDEIEYLNDKIKIKEIEGMGNEMRYLYEVLGKVK